jgi:hypothetical protein
MIVAVIMDRCVHGDVHNDPRSLSRHRLHGITARRASGGAVFTTVSR